MDIGSLTGVVSIEDQLSDALTLAIEHVKSFVEDFDGAMGAMAIGAGVAATAITGLVVSITALGEKGSTIIGVENAFDNLAEQAGTTGEALRGGLSDGVRGTIDQMKLMESTSRLLGSGMQLNEDQANLMGSAARELGKATGGDAASGLEILSGALTTGRTRQLAMQIGLIDVQAGEEKFAASIGTTRDQLSAAGLLEGKRIAILDATQGYLDRLGSSELSFAEKVKQGWVAIEEWGDKLAKSVATSKDVNTALDTVGAAIAKAFGSTSDDLMTTIVDGINAFARGVTDAVPYVVSFGEEVKSVWDFLADNKDTIIDVTKIVAAFSAGWAFWVVGGALVTGIVEGFGAIALAVEGVTIAIAANPLGALAVAAVAAGLAIKGMITATSDADLAFETAGAQQDVMTKAVIAGDTALIGLKPSAENAAAAAKFLADKTKEATEEHKKHSEALKDNDQYLKNHKAQVDALIQSMTDGGKGITIIREAFDKLSDAQLHDSTVLEQLLPQLDKIIKAHQTLNPAMQTAYERAVQLKNATTDQGSAYLATQGVTLEFIDTQKNLGTTEQELATMLGVTIEALKRYEDKQKDLRDFEKDSLKTSIDLWQQYADEVNKSLASSRYDTAKDEIKKWYDTQMDLLDAAERKEIEKYKGNSDAIIAEFAKRRDAFGMIEQQKLANLDQSFALQNTSSKAFYDQQAALATAEYNTRVEHSNAYTDLERANAKKVADELTISAQNWVPWSTAGKTAAGELEKATNSATGAINNLTTATVTGSATQVKSINAVTSSYWDEVDAAFAALAAASGGLDSSTGHRPGTGPFNNGSVPNAPRTSAGVNDSGFRLPGFTLNPHATGGYVDRPALVGENQPEMFIPSSSGTILPSAGGAGAITVNMNVQGVWDPATVKDMTRRITDEMIMASGRRF